MEFGKPELAKERKQITRRAWQLEYAVRDLRSKQISTAEKPSITFAFHGFARPLEDMLAWEPHWSHEGLLVCIHLPHHGKSGPISGLAPMDHPLTSNDLIAILEQIAREEGAASTRWNMIGYSIGGRVALALFHHRPDQWNHVVLMAPDGLKKSPFYRVTVHTKLGKWMWFAIDKNAPLVLSCLNRLRRWKLISNHLHSFCEFHLVSHEMRMMVWHGWRSHRALWPSKEALRKAMTSWQGQMDLCFGDRDLIIPYANSLHLQRALGTQPHIRFHVIPSGHGMLREDVIIEVNRRILTP